MLGVSRDSIKSHQNFCAKQGFKFDLVSDADEALCNAFGVIKPKKLYGREYVGVERSTFLIDPKGVIAQHGDRSRCPAMPRPCSTPSRNTQRSDPLRTPVAPPSRPAGHGGVAVRVRHESCRPRSQVSGATTQ